jgi:hypothetical protein
MFVAFTFIFCNLLVHHNSEFHFLLYMNPCLLNTRCLQSTRSLSFTLVILLYRLSFPNHTVHYYDYFTVTVFPLLSSFCAPVATKGCTVGTGYGALVSDTMQPFGANSCHFHDTIQCHKAGQYRLSFQCCGNLMLRIIALILLRKIMLCHEVM